jgi:TM2 domain-containing membrane protein YozV
MNCANHPERERVSFCQNCGKPLCPECTRAIGAGVFCEPCLAARLAAADAAASGHTVPPVYGVAAGVPPVPGAPNPALAGLLGFIPGVGAMYNGQYAKGVVHLIIFVVLVSLANQFGPFGILVAGWVFYQVFEAYHTARARRDGTPLPNPFGLNDIGERFGFDKGWSAGAASPPVQPFGAPPAAGYTAPPPNTPTAANWGARTHTYAYQETPGPPYAPPIPPYSEAYTAPYAAPPYVDQQFVPGNRFPMGAVWLIAVGVLFFFGSSGVFHRFPIERMIPFFLIGLGVWVFVHKMTSSGQALADDGSPAYRLRVFRALRGSIWLILVGVLFALDSFNILSWGKSWPLFIIVAGLMTFLERSAYNAAAPLPYGYAAAGPAPQAPASPEPGGTSIVPSNRHDEEGR